MNNPDPSETPEDFRQRLELLRGKKPASSLPEPVWPQKSPLSQASDVAPSAVPVQNDKVHADGLRQKQDVLKSEMLERFLKYTRQITSAPQTDSPEDLAEELAEEMSADDEPPSELTLPRQATQLSEKPPYLGKSTPPAALQGSNDEAQTGNGVESLITSPSGTSAKSRDRNLFSARHFFLELQANPPQLPVTPPVNEKQIQPAVTAEQQAAMNRARELLPPGVLCQAVVLKPSAGQKHTSWELCYRKYDTLKSPLDFFQELQFRFTPQKLIYNSFVTQEMVADLVVACVCIQQVVLENGESYQFVELTTLREQHQIVLYPLPPLPCPQWTLLQFENNLTHFDFLSDQPLANKAIALLEHPFQLEQPIFEPHPLFPLLGKPLVYYEPLFDLEKRLKRRRSANSRDAYRLFVSDPQTEEWQRLTLTPLHYEKITLALHQLFNDTRYPQAFRDFLRPLQNVFISRWVASPQQRWFFSCVSADSTQTGKHYLLGLLEWRTTSDNLLLPFIFSFQSVFLSAQHAFWQVRLIPGCVEHLAASAKTILKTEVPLGASVLLCPSGYFQQILAQQAFSLTPLDFRDVALNRDTNDEKSYKVEVATEHAFRDPGWQCFGQSCESLTQVFELFLQISLLDASETIIETRIQNLMTNSRLPKNLRRQLRQRFEEFRVHSEQVYRYADQDHYILVFWQTFFQALFQSIEIPDSLCRPVPVSQPYRLRRGQDTVYLEIYGSISQAQESLHWVIEREHQQKGIRLADILLVNDHLGIPLNIQPLRFVQVFQCLPENIKAFIQPFWTYFEPLKHL